MNPLYKILLKYTLLSTKKASTKSVLFCGIKDLNTRSRSGSWASRTSAAGGRRGEFAEGAAIAEEETASAVELRSECFMRPRRGNPSNPFLLASRFYIHVGIYITLYCSIFIFKFFDVFSD